METGHAERKKTMKWSDVFQDPDMIGQSGYSAIHDAIANTVMECDEPAPDMELSHEDQTGIFVMLNEFRDWANILIRRLRSNACTIRVDKVDWGLLRRQKLKIVELAWDQKAPKASRDALEGVIALLDDIQDQAAKALGEEKVFGEN